VTKPKEEPGKNEPIRERGHVGRTPPPPRASPKTRSKGSKKGKNRQEIDDSAKGGEKISKKGKGEFPKGGIAGLAGKTQRGTQFLRGNEPEK